MTGLDVKIERIKNRIPQYRVAASLGIPATTLSKIENGQVVVGEDRLLGIAAAIRDLSEAGARAGKTGVFDAVPA